jgi:uncharacterized protein YeaO (DUF488 family)
MEPREYSSPACFLHELEIDARAPAAKKMDVRIKRIYEDPTPADGRRVLVDRLWPRGVSKDRAAIYEWLKTLAPSAKLRKWFGHDPNRWKEFRRLYREELLAQSEALARLRKQARSGRVTLLYAARDPRFNHAVVLQEVIRGRKSSRVKSARG